MAQIQIPVRNDFPNYEFQVELEGRIFFLGFRFNTRANRWFMDIQDESQTPIIMGLPILTGLPIGSGFTREAMPPGSFWSVDLTGANRNPDRETFGVDVILVYEESE